MPTRSSTFVVLNCMHALKHSGSNVWASCMCRQRYSCTHSTGQYPPNHKIGAGLKTSGDSFHCRGGARGLIDDQHPSHPPSTCSMPAGRAVAYEEAAARTQLFAGCVGSPRWNLGIRRSMWCRGSYVCVGDDKRDLRTRPERARPVKSSDSNYGPTIETYA